MSSKQIGQGPGNLVPDSKKKQFLASEAISRGQLVYLVSAAGSASYSIGVVDGDAAATSWVAGVAAEDIASGDWGDVVVAGYCDYILTNGSCTVNVAMIPTAPGGDPTGTATDMTDGLEEQVFGVALSTDSGDPTACDGIIFGRFNY